MPHKKQANILYPLSLDTKGFSLYHFSPYTYLRINIFCFTRAWGFLSPTAATTSFSVFHEHSASSKTQRRNHAPNQHSSWLHPNNL